MIAISVAVEASRFQSAQAVGWLTGDQVPSGYQPYGQRFCAGFFALIAHARSMAGCGGPGGRGDYSGYSGRGQSPAGAVSDLDADGVGRERSESGRWIRICRLQEHGRACVRVDARGDCQRWRSVSGGFLHGWTGWTGFLRCKGYLDSGFSRNDGFDCVSPDWIGGCIRSILADIRAGHGMGR